MFPPRFTLRRAMIAIGLLALFLGWLRPDRAKVTDEDPYELGVNVKSIKFRPSFYPSRIAIDRVEHPDRVDWFISASTTKE